MWFKLQSNILRTDSKDKNKKISLEEFIIDKLCYPSVGQVEFMKKWREKNQNVQMMEKETDKLLGVIFPSEILPYNFLITL